MPDAGIIVDIEVVTGEESDFARMSERLDALEVTLDRRPGTVTADRAYGIGRVYDALSRREIEAFGLPSNQWRGGLTPAASGHAARFCQALPGGAVPL